MISSSHERRSTTRTLRASLVVGAAGAMLALLACSGPKDGQVFVGTFPSADMYPPVSAALELRCGTLDCHGSFSRNLRVYGIDGIRGVRGEVSGNHATTPEEIQLNYESLVSIEPERLSGIVSHAGQGFDHWIVVTKGTNAEHHKGGKRFTKGDPTYVCLLSWVTGNVNMDACAEGAAVVRPGTEQPPGTDQPPSDQPQP